MKAVDLQRGFAYHSRQYPGFTCWCGLWLMPGGEVMASFTEATGPFRDRPRAPEDVRRRLAWPPAGHGNEYDMTGLRLENVHLLSADGGATWRETGRDAFRSCMNGATGESETALADGSLLRGVWGRYLPYDDVPDDGYVQRSTDGGSTWSEPRAIQPDGAQAFWPKRIRALGDGRLLAGGGYYVRHPECDTRERWADDFVPALFVSGDRGARWDGPLPVVDRGQASPFALTEEFDWVELDDGDLLVVLRAGVEEGRLRARLRRLGDGWRPGRPEPAGLPYSGHPELLRRRDGGVLHVATTGISLSDDEGLSWQDVHLDDGLAELRRGPATPYYPRSVQLGDGRVLIIGHVGGDDGYGRVDQSIVTVRFGVER